MAGRCSAASSLRRETVERLDGRPRHDLILRSPRSGRLEGRSRRRRRARWSVLRDATPAAPLLRTRRRGRTAATLSVTVARNFRCKPLKRLIPRPGLRRTRNFRPSRPAGTCFETRRFALLLSMRSVIAHPPPRRLTIARKFCCKPLKRLIPRPAFRRSPKPLAARMRRDPGPARPPLTRSGETRRRLTIALKIRRKPLQRLIPRPGLRRTRNFRPSRPAGTCFETRRLASLLSMRAASARPPRRLTIARKFCCKPLKRLIPRPGLRRTCNFRPSRPAGTCVETRRFASLLSMRAVSARPPPRRLTTARKFYCKPLKRLIPRPETSRRADGAGPPRPASAGRTGAPGAKFPGGGRRPEPGRSPEGVHGGALCRLSSRYPTTCIVSHVAASAGLCRPSISTLTS